MDTEEFLASLELPLTRTEHYFNFSELLLRSMVRVSFSTVLLRLLQHSQVQVLVVNTRISVTKQVLIYLELDTSATVVAIGTQIQLMVTQVQHLPTGDYRSLHHWRRYETLEFEDAIGEVSFDLDAVTVSVTERKLRAQWSPELAQDVFCIPQH